MELAEILCPTSKVDLFALHYIYMSRVQQSLDEFQRQWNFHSPSSMGYIYPLAPWSEGVTSDPVLLENMCDSLHLDKSLWGESRRVGAHKFKTLFRDMGLADILCPTIDEIQVLEEKSAAPVEITARRRPPEPIELIKAFLDHYSLSDISIPLNI